MGSQIVPNRVRDLNTGLRALFIPLSRILLIVPALLLAGCMASPRLSVPENLTSAATIANLPGVRFFGDDTVQNVEQIVAVKVEQSLRERPEKWNRKRAISVDFLIITGGGPDGAFTAGLLNGMSQADTRIDYEVVTGVSTGALSAPFVFLGPKYDAQLREVYTNTTTKDVVRPAVLAGVLGASALGTTEPLQKLIAKFVTAEFLAEIAREYRAGRRLFVGTTNIDAQRPVIWNMGRIAEHGGPQALALFRKVLLASASIPAAFPPVRFDVQIGGEIRQELHVDGGATNNAFFLPLRVGLGAYLEQQGLKVKRTMYIIRNSRADPEWENVEESALSIAKRSISTLLKSSTTGDMFKLYEFSKRNGIAFRLASVPQTFTVQSKETFDQHYMRALYQVGLDLGLQGYKWAKVPPGL